MDGEIWDGEIWDEERWEAFLRENDRHLERCMGLLFRFMSNHPPVGEDGSPARRAWEDRLRAFLLSNGIRLEDLLLRGRIEDDEPLEEDDVDLSAPDVLEDAAFGLERHPLYRTAQGLASRVLGWSNTLPGHVKDSTLVQFCSHVTQIPAHLAKGHGIGYEMETIGGNIACAKRALASANSALDLLRELRAAGYMERTVYGALYEDVFELRNDIGIHVQELRERFDLGID